MVGESVTAVVGLSVGSNVGSYVVGDWDGKSVGVFVTMRALDGSTVGLAVVGDGVGSKVGSLDG